jgi:hypothetical protein
MKIKRIKSFIEWKVIPFIGDVIKNGLMFAGLVVGSALPAIIGILAFHYFGLIASVITVILIIGIVSTIVERSV